jgi:hypothetical protein
MYDIAVLVKGAAGQPIQGTLFELIKGGTTIARAATDTGGTAVFTKVIGAYYLEHRTGQFRAETSLLIGIRKTQITLDIYTLLIEVQVNFATFLVLSIGFILLIIVVAFAVSEYIH